MKYSDIFKKRINCSTSDQVFGYLIATLKETITRWDYFVNWKKVTKNVEDIEMDLKNMNYLIGKDHIEDAFKRLLEKHPSIAQTIPVVIACRQNDFKILYRYDYAGFKYKRYVFTEKTKLSDKEIAEIVEFARNVGFLNLLEKKKIKNLVDYVLGIEVGIDSNGRKNRGGVSMEEVVEYFVSDICNRNNLQYIKGATFDKIYKMWGKKITVDKSLRILDFAVFNKKKLFLIETNFYGGGGSKLKSTAGEYRAMFDFWKKDGHGFIWITDGKGWQSTKLPLQETFNHNDYILNLDMVSNKLLEDIITKNL